MLHGITFSHHQLQYLNCSVFDALDYAFTLNLDYLRICTHWDEIEKKAGEYDWNLLEKIISTCQKNKQNIILTLGVKAPRWPEFYFPQWVEDKDPTHPQTQKKILEFITHTINKLKKYSCIKYYQIENEALDPSGPSNQTIPLSFLEKEITLVRQLDPTRPIITTLWGNSLSKRDNFPQLSIISDIVGLDIYYQQFLKKILSKNIYIGPLDSTQKISQIIEKSQTPAWIMELQAEPWESSEQEYLADNPQSISPQKIKTFYQKARQLPVQAIFFWGFEYWWWRHQQGDSNYLETISQITNPTTNI